MTGEIRRPWRRQAALVGAAVLLGLPVVLAPGALAGPPPRGQSLDDLRLREDEAAGQLEDSSQQVQAAAATLRTVAAQLPAAQSDVARAKGELAGAQAKLAAAQAAVTRAEQARAAAQGRVDEAGGKVSESRKDIDGLARQSYQRGRLGAITDVMEAGDPQDVLERASMMKSVFRYQDTSLERLTRDRLSLARVTADLAADERSLQRLRATAQEGQVRAQQITVEAESAAARVAALVASQQAAVVVAEDARAQDLRDYEAAQAASRALAEQIRRAAAEAAAAEARRQAEEARRLAEERAARERADQAARQRAAAAGRPAPPPRAAPRAAPQAAPAAPGRMVWPVAGRLTSRFGFRTHPIYGDRRLHAGVDIGSPNGTPISSAQGGTVIMAGNGGSYGNLVVVSHGNGLTTAYAHMSSIAVRSGQSVAAGQQVGAVGSTGASTGNHLHFEVRLNGEPVDPLSYTSPP